MVKAGRVHRLVREAAHYGTAVGEVRVDWGAVMRRQREIVAALEPPVASIEKTGARVALGRARFENAHTVAVDGARLGGERIVIAAGSEPVMPDIPGRELGITSDQILFLPERPDELVLVGGGVIALEMAGAYADFGSRVTVVARDAEILPGVDPDVAAYLRTIMEAKGVRFRLAARVTALAGRPGALRASGEDTRGGFELAAAQVCFAIGRRFRPGMLGAEGLGLETAGPGLKVTPYLRTSLPHVYAAGDAAGQRQLTTTAAYEGRLAAVNALRGDTERPDYAVVPQVIFTTPEVGSVGLSQREAHARGLSCAVTRHDARGNSNGRATGEEGGYFKLVFDEGSGRLVGAQMVSYAAAELIQLCALAIRSGARAADVAAQLSIHPSHGERLLKSFGPDLREVCEVD